MGCEPQTPRLNSKTMIVIVVEETKICVLAWVRNHNIYDL